MNKYLTPLSATILRIICSVTFLCSPLCIGSALAQDPEDEVVEASPKAPWGELESAPKETPWYIDALLWVPNRVLDFIDIFRVDVGAGPAFGGVVRLTKYGQVGFRTVAPASLRVGAFGRDYPVMVESSSEFGIGPAYVSSKDREICMGEFGAGIDLFLVGGYAGICADELLDFVGGLVFIDVKDDDLTSSFSQ